MDKSVHEVLPPNASFACQALLRHIAYWSFFGLLDVLLVTECARSITTRDRTPKPVSGYSRMLANERIMFRMRIKRHDGRR